MAVIRITSGNFRLVQRLFGQIVGISTPRISARQWARNIRCPTHHCRMITGSAQPSRKATYVPWPIMLG